MLSVHDLVVRYAGINALDQVSLDLAPGEVLAVLGPNGAGKSSLIRALSRQVPVTSGSIMFLGKSINNTPAFEVARLGIVQSPEGRDIFGTLTVRENLRVGAIRRGLPLRNLPEEMSFIAELFPRLTGRLRQQAGTLSGGEQQMLALARCVIAKPKLLLLDEPSLGLSPKILHDVYEAISRIVTRETGVILVEQNARSALRVATRALVMASGKICHEGSPADIFEVLSEGYFKRK
jgi:branched-chain amino acid transport system ATP-binding protein